HPKVALPAGGCAARTPRRMAGESGRGVVDAMTAPPIEALNRQRLAELAQSYEGDIVRFLRDLIAIPAESGHEGPVVARIRQEMEEVGFDEVRIDPMGNILGRIGSGKTIIMMDSHTDTVGVGDPKEWAWDPYQG